MDELIEQLTSKLGIDAQVARNATGKTMQSLQSNLDSDLFAKITAAIPGIQDMIRSAGASAGSSTAASTDGGGLLGQIAGMASKVLGKDVSGGIELGTSLTEGGLPKDKIASFIALIVNFIKQKAGDEVMNQILAKFPMLKVLLSNAG